MTETAHTAEGHTIDVETDDAAAGYDPLAALTIGEIDAGSRVLKASLVHAITEQSVDYSKALAVLLWLHRRRADRAAQLAPCLDLTYEQIGVELGALGDPTSGPEDPTAPRSG
jgi:hypothetical protein